LVIILEACSNSTIASPFSILPTWINGGANAALFLFDLFKPWHGKLHLDTDDNWIFCLDVKGDLSKGIKLPDLYSICQMLLDTGQLFHGHTKFPRVYHARNQVQPHHCVLQYASAHDLTSLLTPSSLKYHINMVPDKKVIWDVAYDEEFDGLSCLSTCQVITEDQFRKLSKGVKALPTMAIATIRYDAHNFPNHAKYQIIILGNSDYHIWSKESTAAPVMSQHELCILSSLAVYNKRVLKNCDKKQAFVQSSLPED
jgi:hypothetical protein